MESLVSWNVLEERRKKKKVAVVVGEELEGRQEGGAVDCVFKRRGGIGFGVIWSVCGGVGGEWWTERGLCEKEGKEGRKEGGMKPGDRRKDKVQHHTSLYRSASSPGIVSSYEKDTEKREEVVVGGYGLPPIHSPSSDCISSSSPAMAINHPGYQQQERGLTGVTTTTPIAGGGSKGRKRPGRKTRQAVDGYGSSPDAHGTSPPYRNGSYLSLSLVPLAFSFSLVVSIHALS